MALSAAVYRPRRPQDSDYYRCVEDYFETFVQNYDENFSRQHGFWRPYIAQVTAVQVAAHHLIVLPDDLP